MIAFPTSPCPGLDGKLRKFIWSFTGAPVALVAVDDLANLDAGQFAGLIDCLQGAPPSCLSWSAGNAVAGASAPWSKLGGTPEAPLLLCDRRAQVLGRAAGPGRHAASAPAGALRMRVIVLDPNQRIAATFDSRPLPAAAEAMDGLARSVRSDGGREPLLQTPMAPVLVLPRVFEPDFCAQLVRLWGKGDHKDSGVSSRYGDINMDHLKRTEDYTVVEPMMLKAISDRLAYRIGPELTKVFAFDRQFTFDSHIVLSYSADAKHFFGAHRDNGAPTTADRAFAVSLNLNDDFEGGELVFPEYAGVPREPARRRRRRLLLLAAAPGAAGDARPALRADDLLPRQILMIPVARRVVRLRQLDARLVERRIEDVDARRLVEGAVGAGDVLARDQLAHRCQQLGDLAAALGLFLLRRLHRLAQLGDLRRLRASAARLRPAPSRPRHSRRCRSAVRARSSWMANRPSGVASSAILRRASAVSLRPGTALSASASLALASRTCRGRPAGAPGRSDEKRDRWPLHPACRRGWSHRRAARLRLVLRGAGGASAAGDRRDKRRRRPRRRRPPHR